MDIAACRDYWRRARLFQSSFQYPCAYEAGLARMRFYEEKKITSPCRLFEVKGAEP